ncbi:hypothetical protein FE634_10105 [Nocardioides dongxiaopingii]|uniref:hypothetical protein n=1 Tax=Nocardioides sp. S-1144 TaxID=2582905 RepID=UPI00110F2A0F|nr:hypothetical protein [Nocardioides sp. S-1144]QCW50677.1 hypothetical protein FE634_10105 [Nocardioides sp. S-1144]
MIRRLALLAAALVALAPLSAVPAHADRWSDNEPVGDARTVTFDPEPEPCGTVTQRPSPDGDIRRLAVRHTKTDLVLRLDVVGLPRPRSVFAEFTVRTSRHDWLVTVDSFATGGPDVSIGRAPDLTDVEPDECGYITYTTGGSRCADTEARIDRSAGTVVATVPRRCLGRPEWVRVGADVQNIAADGSYDRWSPRGADNGDWRTPVFGPRVRASR